MASQHSTRLFFGEARSWRATITARALSNVKGRAHQPSQVYSGHMGQISPRHGATAGRHRAPQTGRAPELCATIRAQSLFAVISCSFGHGPSAASAAIAGSSVTDRGAGNHREMNLRAQLVITPGRSRRFAAPDAVQPRYLDRDLGGCTRSANYRDLVMLDAPPSERADAERSRKLDGARLVATQAYVKPFRSGVSPQ